MSPMKKLINLLLCAPLLMLAPSDLMAQCGNELLGEVAKKLDGFIYVKDFPVELKKKKGDEVPSVDHTVILNAGHTYRIYVQDPPKGGGQLIAVLHNHGNAIASTFEIIDVPMRFEYIEFECRKTDVYNLRFSFETASGCGLGVLAVASGK
jgi:hypothetical protein